MPIPTLYLYCEDEAILGTPFYAAESMGDAVTHDYALPGMALETGAIAYCSVARALAAIHVCDWQAGGLANFGRPGNYFARQVACWAKQWSQFGIADNPDFDRLRVWLTAHMPAEDVCSTIAHGDFRMANMMLRFDGTVWDVFDWELATIGQPTADLGYFLQGRFLQPDENGGIDGLDLAASGTPTAHEFVSHYYAAAPDMPQLTAFHIAFAMYRAAVGASSVALRAEAGASPNPCAATEARRFARAYARAGIHAIENWD